MLQTKKIRFDQVLALDETETSQKTAEGCQGSKQKRLSEAPMTFHEMGDKWCSKDSARRQVSLFPLKENSPKHLHEYGLNNEWICHDSAASHFIKIPNSFA